MSACPGAKALAGAATGGDAAAALHAATCARCGPIVDELRDTAGALARLPAPELSASRRAALADAVVVSARHLSPAARPIARPIAIAACAIAAAAAALLVATRTRPEVVALAPRPAQPHAITVTPIAPETAVHALGDATYEIDRSGARPIVHVHGDGGIAIQPVAPVDVEVGGTTVALGEGAFEIHARRGAVDSVRVFAGSAQIRDEHGTRNVVRGELWERPATPPRAPRPAEPATTATDWFRIGWLALRDGRYAEAIAAFDRADDPAIAEDSAFWAAVAAERAGAADARARFEHFLAAFPSSDRRAAAADHAARLR